MGVIKVIDEVCEDICINYCKYSEESLKALDEDIELEQCKNCPLDRLR